MTVAVRDRVFETNSSSSHSVALGQGDTLEKNFDQESLRSGVINIKCAGNGHTYYGEERFRYYQPENIVRYLLATIVRGGADTSDVDTSQSYDAMPLLKAQFDGVSDLIDAVEDETKCKVTLMVGAGKRVWLDVDDEADANFDFSNRDNLRRLLFHASSYIETKSRNECEDAAPEYTDTDMGEEPTDRPGEDRQLGFNL